MAVTDSAVTMYGYHNHDLGGAHGKALIYLDPLSGTVQLQGKNHITPWHGSWCDFGPRLEIYFDALAGTKDHDTRLKSSRFFTTLAPGHDSEYAFQGYDYCTRRVSLKPVSRWSCLSNGAWRRTADWSQVFQEWLYTDS